MPCCRRRRRSSPTGSAAFCRGAIRRRTLPRRGSLGTTKIGLPVIRALPDRPRVRAVLGHGGNGITCSRIAAELIATVLDGGEGTDADLYTD